VLSNTDIAELLAQQSEREAGVLSRAFRRAARSAFLWPEEVSDLVAQNRSLTELRGIGPFIEKQIHQWIMKPHPVKLVSSIRRDFLSLAYARRVLAARPDWTKKLRGDLQMHSRWSDGSGTLAEMAHAAANRSLGTDAHHAWQLEFIELGLAAVLRAKLRPEQIVNFMPLVELKKWIEQLRALSARRNKSKCI